MNQQEEHRNIIFYDGVCALCNWFVTVLLKLDTEGRFYFASQQSEVATVLLSKHGVAHPAPSLESIFYLDEHSGILLKKSKAIFEIGKHLQSPWRYIAYVCSLLPRGIADFFYDQVAKNRYRTFGKYDICPLPEQQYRSRFL